MGYKVRQKSSPVVNVVAGQIATHDLNSGPRYLGVRYIFTGTKTAATGGFTSATLADLCGLITVNVNNAPKRTHLAVELNAVQSKWHANLAAKQFDGVANDLITAVADVVAGGNTTRTTTWVLDLWFMEPSRDSYRARQAFAWPTQWNDSKGNSVAQCAIQIQLTVAPTGNAVNPVVRAEETIDFVTGAYAKLLASGQPDTTSAPVMPVTHWYRQPEVYAGLTPVIRKFPFNGALQQTTFFCQAGDDVNQLQVKVNNVIQFDRSKKSNDDGNQAFDWSPTYGAGTANVNYLDADMFDLAFDFDDNPQNALPPAAVAGLEYDITLSAAAAANKTLILMSQVYRDALSNT